MRRSSKGILSPKTAGGEVSGPVPAAPLVPIMSSPTSMPPPIPHEISMLRTFSSALLAVLCCSLPLLAVDHKLEKVDEAAPKEGLSAEIAALLSPTGFKVVRGETRVVCEVWLCKEWPIKEAKVGGEVLYPFQPGQVMGVARFPRKGSDFREQDVPAGLYTLRYGQQPVDGAHVGTSPTRDFLLLTPADKDKSPDIIADFKALSKASAQTTGASHPAILSLQRLSDQEPLTIRHQEDKNWWIVRFTGKTRSGDKTTDQAVEAVLVGHAGE